MSRSRWRDPLLVGILGTLTLLMFEALVRTTRAQDLFGGYRFQAWSSEEFMQEVRINDLLEVGPIGLWYLHVQPPMLETLRFLLSMPEYLSGERMTPQMIDERMYAAYAVFYGALLAIAFLWLRSLTGSRVWAVTGVLVIGAYPGTIAMATLLDGTFPSAVLTTLMLYLLYVALRNRSARLLNWWLVSLLVLSWTRTIFQLQILIMIPVVVWLIYRYRMGNRTWVAISVSIALTAGLFLLPLKQYLLYNTTATTSFAGNHQVEVVSYRPTPEELAAVEVPQDILVNASKFVSGFNSPENIATNYTLSQVGNQYYLRDPFQVVKNLIWGAQMNSAQALHWTHDYSIIGAGPANIAADTLPWTPPSNSLLSTTFYVLILLATAGCLLYAFGTRGLLRRARTYLAFIFILATTMITFLLANRYDWTEADRLKFVVVPFFLTLFIASLAWATRARRRHLNPR
jgi:hypothetical protein